MQKIVEKYTWIVAGLIPILICAFLFIFEFRILNGEFQKTGYSIFAFGALISINNLYVAFIRPTLIAKKDLDVDDTNNISPIPLLGILTLIGALLISKSVYLNFIILFLLIGDAGGLSWLLISMFSVSSFEK